MTAFRDTQKVQTLGKYILYYIRSKFFIKKLTGKVLILFAIYNK